MDKNVEKVNQIHMEQCVEQLKRKGFLVDCLEDSKVLLEFLKQEIPKNSTIGVGGSMTLFETGVIDWLTNNQDYTLYDRYHTDDVPKVFHDSLNADYYLMSTNAITLKGELYNVDGNGNRLAALIYGPKKVLVIVGRNKIVKDLEEAKVRVETHTSVANNIRIGLENPCVKTGFCVHCESPSKICNQKLVTESCRPEGRIHILFVNEDLGY